ncbi:hypothetical protein M9X92_005272 [Pyricularia oryzae]|nr:hypothetical protein M9X92_005272 [Pyricularia oryzae]
MNNNYYGTQLTAEQLQRQQLANQQHQRQQRQQRHHQQQQQQQQQQHRQQQHQQHQQRQQYQNAGQVGGGSSMGQDDPMSAITDSPMLDGDSLDDIIRENTHELQRRRSITHPYSPQALESDGRRLSMLEFGNNNDAFNYHFGNMNSLQDNPMGNGFNAMGNSAMGNMGLSNTATGQYDHQGNTNMGMMGMSDSNDFSTLSPEMLGNMVAFSSLNMNPVTTSPTSMGPMFSSGQLGDQYMTNTISMDNMGTDRFGMNMLPDPLSATNDTRRMMSTQDDDSEMLNSGQNFNSNTGQAPDGAHMQAAMNMQGPAPPIPIKNTQQVPAGPHGGPDVSPARDATALSTPPSNIGPSTTPSGGVSKPKSIYSKTGFDMVRALYMVATRKNPQINLGAVDMSCAFVVSDINLPDCPIIYVSSNFQNLTGYSEHEIIGKNCRFLQAPDGQVEAGVKREFVADDAVFSLKKAIAERKEIQQSLINYRKGGKPFLNLLTMIPIPWEEQELRYYIGFQIDVVECPDAIAQQEFGGQMQINYRHMEMGQYIWTGPPLGTDATLAPEQDSSQTLSADDVSGLLRQAKPQGLASDWHRQSWDKMLLENSDDVVHVLSLKGTFLYLSPSCKKVLGYDAAELVGPNTQGTGLMSICHPSDLIPVMRELKDATPTNPIVNTVYRISRKKTGYTWFESHGTLCVEPGKGRKFIILVGRKRPVYHLSKKDVEANGGIGDSELWTKLSVSGMFLFVSSHVRSLLDLQPQDLVGTSIQDLMRKESRAEFGRTIEKARKGKIVTCKHEVQNRRGQVLQASTTLYPGDTPVGQRPTFILAQTKLVKASSRSSASAASGKKSQQNAVSSESSMAEGNVPPTDRSVSTDALSSAVSKDRTSASSSKGPESTTTISDQAPTGLPLNYPKPDDNIFVELGPTRCTSWQYELRQMEKDNRLLAEELGQLLSNKKKRKRRRSAGLVRDCANCHTRSTPEWRRGPSGQRDLCNSCGLRWAKQVGRVSPRTSSRGGGTKDDSNSRKSNSPSHQSPLQREFSSDGNAANNSPSSNQAVVASASDAADAGSSAGVTPTIGVSQGSMPPQSQPLLEGGSGYRGGGMEMTSICEE